MDASRSGSHILDNDSVRRCGIVRRWYSAMRVAVGVAPRAADQNATAWSRSSDGTSITNVLKRLRCIKILSATLAPGERFSA
jgi:hypothetical protein